MTESPLARKLRQIGWDAFCELIRELRGYKCEVCGKDEPWDTRQVRGQAHTRFHIHHFLKQRDNQYRHLKFEPDNVILVCQPCHAAVEGLSREAAYDIGGKFPPLTPSFERCVEIAKRMKVAIRGRHRSRYVPRKEGNLSSSEVMGAL